MDLVKFTEDFFKPKASQLADFQRGIDYWNSYINATSEIYAVSDTVALKENADSIDVYHYCEDHGGSDWKKCQAISTIERANMPRGQFILFWRQMLSK